MYFNCKEYTYTNIFVKLSFYEHSYGLRKTESKLQIQLFSSQIVLKHFYFWLWQVVISRVNLVMGNQLSHTDILVIVEILFLVTVFYFMFYSEIKIYFLISTEGMKCELRTNH